MGRPDAVRPCRPRAGAHRARFPPWAAPHASDARFRRAAMASVLAGETSGSASGADAAPSSTADKVARVCSITGIFDSCAARDPAADGGAAPMSSAFRIISADSPSAPAPAADAQARARRPGPAGGATGRCGVALSAAWATQGGAVTHGGTGQGSPAGQAASAVVQVPPPAAAAQPVRGACPVFCAAMSRAAADPHGRAPPARAAARAGALTSRAVSQRAHRRSRRAPAPRPRAELLPLGSGTPPEKRNLVQALRREAERLIGLEHYESAEIVITEALTVRSPHAARPLMRVRTTPC